MIPSTVVWVMLVAFLRGAQNGWFGESTIGIAGRVLPVAALFIIAIVLIGVFVAIWVLDARQRVKELRRPVRSDEIDPFEGGYPVPPLPGQTLREPIRRPAVGVSTVKAKEQSRD
jgi:NADH-quinone oxidoreductase subunit H